MPHVITKSTFERLIHLNKTIREEFCKRLEVDFTKKSGLQIASNPNKDLTLKNMIV